jgi:hypothetical protein
MTDSSPSGNTPHRQPLTDNQKAVLDYCKRYMDREGVFPSMRTIQDAMGWKSVNSAFQYIDALREKGYLRKQSGSYAFTEGHLYVGPEQLETLDGLIRALLGRMHLLLQEAGRDATVARAEVSRWRSAFDQWVERSQQAV